MERPDKWVLIEITQKKSGKTFRVVLCEWSGGYLDGNRWKRSSPVQNVLSDNDNYTFVTASGNEYVCNKKMQGLGLITSGIFEQMESSKDHEVRLVDKIEE